jgi:mono/diheme cytochrome c family protein
MRAQWVIHEEGRRMRAMMTHRAFLLVLATALFASRPTTALSDTAVPPGELLYQVNCNECHTAYVHWRDHRRAIDWETLQSQVWRWQGNLGVNWSQEQIDAVSDYLNRRYYQFPVERGVTSR